MTKKEFVNTVAKSTEITEKQAKQFIETFMDSISKQQKGEPLPTGFLRPILNGG
jgi:nucleoid DNA-binding protein